MVFLKPAFCILAVILVIIFVVVFQKSKQNVLKPVVSTYDRKWRDYVKVINSSNNEGFIYFYDSPEINNNIEYSFWNMVDSDTTEKHYTNASNLTKSEPKYCNCSGVKVLQHSYADDSDIMCIKMATVPKSIVCVYDPVVDIYISQELIREGTWESHIVSKFVHILQILGPKIGVLDLGANIGVYSLIAATLGHNVISVEPSTENVKRLYKAGKVGGILEKITIIQNGISNECTEGFILKSRDNQGDTRVGISSGEKKSFTEHKDHENVNITTLHCLLPYLNNTSIIVKVDIQGYEHRAFVDIDKVLDSVHIPYIFMEWSLMREYYYKARSEKLLVRDMIRTLFHRGYKPHSLFRRKTFLEKYWFGWPDDVLWIHKDASEEV